MVILTSCVGLFSYMEKILSLVSFHFLTSLQATHQSILQVARAADDGGVMEWAQLRGKSFLSVLTSTKPSGPPVPGGAWSRPASRWFISRPSDGAWQSSLLGNYQDIPLIIENVNSNLRNLKLLLSRKCEEVNRKLL